jgi:hypothetical protein
MIYVAFIVCWLIEIRLCVGKKERKRNTIEEKGDTFEYDFVFNRYTLVKEILVIFRIMTQKYLNFFIQKRLLNQDFQTY